jgi:iron complex transport system substrate-binding protein
MEDGNHLFLKKLDIFSYVELRLIKYLKTEINKIEEKTKRIINKKSVACIEWIEPMMNAGNWIPTVIEKAGGINTMGIESSHSHYIRMENLIEIDPDIILIMPCGFDIKRSLEEMHLIENQTGWNQLKAVKNNEVYITDGNQNFNRPGPRILESIQIVAEILYPDLFDFKLEGKTWINHIS